MITVNHVTKRYGRATALDDLSLAVDEPGIYCLLGRNGAGKTTLLKTIAGHVAPTSGTVAVDGRAVGPLSMPTGVHFVATDATQFNMPLTRLFTAAAAINPQFDADFATEMARRFQLDVRKRYHSLSFGMKAMANTLIALCSGKHTLLLDEPVLGFDPLMRTTFYDLLDQSVAERAHTVIVSTHIIDEIAKVAGRLIVIDEGRLKLFTDMADIDERAYTVTGPAAQVAAATAGLNVIAEKRAGGFVSRSVFDRRIESSDGAAVASMGLQDFFIALVGDTDSAAFDAGKGN